MFYIRVSCVYESLTFQIGKMCVCGDFEILKRSWTGNLFCCAVMLRCTRFWGIEQSKAPYENIINNACACQTLNSVAHYKCIRELLLPATDLCENAYASVDIGVAFASTPSFWLTHTRIFFICIYLNAHCSIHTSDKPRFRWAWATTTNTKWHYFFFLSFKNKIDGTKKIPRVLQPAPWPMKIN